MFVYALLNMDNLTKHRKDRLRALIDGKPYAGNQAEFGRKAGLTKARITQLLNPDEPFGERAAESLCAKLELSPRWFEQGLAAGEGEMVPAAAREPSNVSPAHLRARVPIINWVQAGCWAEIEPGFDLSNTDNWHEVYNGSPGRHAFALVVEGDSMVSPYPGERSFPPGTVIVVDPDRGSNAGDYVVAKDVANQRATFKRLAHDAGRWFLRPLNPSYPTLEIDDPAIRVIGRVVEFSISGVL